MRIERLNPGINAVGADSRISVFLIRDQKWGWSCEVRRGSFYAMARHDGEFGSMKNAELRAIDWASSQGASSAIIESLSEERESNPAPSNPDCLTEISGACGQSLST